MGENDGSAAGPRLPGTAPQDLKDFIACTRDVAELDTARLDWIKRPEGSPDSPIEFSAGDAPNTGSIRIGWGYMSLELPVSLVDGSLTVEVPSYYPDQLENGITDWVRQLNQTIRANGKEFESFEVQGSKITLRKRAIGGGAAGAASTAAVPSASGTGTSTNAAPTPSPSPDASGNPGCLTKVLVAIAALAAAVGLTWGLTRGGDSPETVTSPDTEETVPVAAPDPTTTPTATITAPTPTPTVTQVGQVPAGDTGDNGAEVAAAIPCDWGTATPGVIPELAVGSNSYWELSELHATCNQAPADHFASCDPSLPCAQNSTPFFAAFGTGVSVGHRGDGPPDAVTGERGPSDDGLVVAVRGFYGEGFDTAITADDRELAACYSLEDPDARALCFNEYLYGDSAGLTARVSKDCGGLTITGEASVSPLGPTEVRSPLFFFGECNVDQMTFYNGPTSGEPVLTLPGNLFGDDGTYVVSSPETTATAPDLDRLASWGRGFELSDRLTDAAYTTHNLLGGSQNPNGSCSFFTSPNDVARVAKLLDGCQSNGRFWVFAGALTNVEVELTVTDTATGDLRSFDPLAHGAGWVNSGGGPAPTVQDTSAFSAILFNQTIFPCGPGIVAITVCPDGEPSVPTGGLVAASVVFPDAVPLAPDPPTAIEVDYSVAGGPTYRIEGDDQGWSLSSSEGATAARAIVRHNAVTVVVPQAELPFGALAYVLRTEVDGDVLEQPVVPVAGVIRAPDIAAATGTEDAAPEPVEAEDLEQFYAQLSASVAAGDLGFALDRLHPAVLDAYPGQCSDALSSFADPDLVIEFFSEGDVGAWTWELPDGRSFDITDATTVTIALSGRGQSGSQTESHLVLDDGLWYWFTFCA